jgi:uncharacterized membrane protein YdjX (TVP38/TMEM64 family)
MRRLFDFLLNMEARRWRTLAAALVLFGLIVALFAFGKSALGLDQGVAGAEARLEGWLDGFGAGPWGLVATVVLFVASAFVGAPQFVLIAACVVVFGPWAGFGYSWIGTMVSAGVTYWLGRGPTARLLARYGGATAGRLARFVGDNAFYASFMIRNVPSAPFIVVNMAFGAARARFWPYLAGCAVGVLPKTALVAFFGGSFMSAVRGDGVWTAAILAAVSLAWLGVMLAVREWVKRREDRRAGPALEGDGGAP